MFLGLLCCLNLSARSPAKPIYSTIFVQSPLSQPLVHRNKDMYEAFAKQSNAPVGDLLSEQGKEDIKMVEGILIEAFHKK